VSVHIAALLAPPPPKLATNDAGFPRVTPVFQVKEFLRQGSNSSPSVINWLIEKNKSRVSIENKLFVYKAVVKTIWSNGIEPRGCASKSNIVIMLRSQSKILRTIANAPRYVTNHTLHTDFNIPCVSDVIHETINKHHNNLEAHPNPLLEALLQPLNTRRLKRCWPYPTTS